MTVKELIIKLLEEDMDAKVLVSINKVHYNEHGRCEGYLFNIDSVNYEYDACMINFKDSCGVLESVNPQHVNRASVDEYCREHDLVLVSRKRYNELVKTSRKLEEQTDYPFDPNVPEMGQL